MNGTMKPPYPDQNEKQEWACYDKFKFTGYSPMDMIDGHLIVPIVKLIVVKMQKDAAKEGVIITVDSAFRSFTNQFETRKKNRKAFEIAWSKANGNKPFPNSKIDDENFLLTAKSDQFLPATAAPGESNHAGPEDVKTGVGFAVDFKTKDKNGVLMTGKTAPYSWLVRNAYKYGLIRTVPSERWHHEYRPGVDRFSRVPRNHPTWDNLIESEP